MTSIYVRVVKIIQKLIRRVHTRTRTLTQWLLESHESDIQLNEKYYKKGTPGERQRPSSPTSPKVSSFH